MNNAIAELTKSAEESKIIDKENEEKAYLKALEEIKAKMPLTEEEKK